MDILPDISKKKASKRESLGLKVLERRDISINERFLQIEKKINKIIVEMQELQCCNIEIRMQTEQLFRILNNFGDVAVGKVAETHGVTIVKPCDKNDSNTGFDDTTKTFCEAKVKVYSFGNIAVGEVDETDGVTLVKPSIPR